MWSLPGGLRTDSQLALTALTVMVESTRGTED